MTATLTLAHSTQESPCPQKLGDTTEHFWLIQRMAKTSGLDLAEAMHQGVLDQEDWAAMVTRCRGCAWAEGCHRWLDIVGQTSESAPDTCLNQARMTELKKKIA